MINTLFLHKKINNQTLQINIRRKWKEKQFNH